MWRTAGAALALVLLQRQCTTLHVSHGVSPCAPVSLPADAEPPTTELVLAELLRNTSDMEDPYIFDIINLTTPTASVRQCGSRMHNACIGGGMYYVWCKKVMDKLMVRNNSVGLSYGISSFDKWSKYMGDNMKIPTRLYDCYETEETTKFQLEQTLVPYERYDVCLGRTAGRDKAGRQFETLGMHLAGRPGLSTLVKLDIEGDEWDVVPDFLESRSEVGKVAQIDIEFHFCGKKKGAWQNVTRTFRRLLEDFVVVGRYPNDSYDRIPSYTGNFTHSGNCGAKDGMPSVISASYVNKGLLA